MQKLNMSCPIGVTGYGITSHNIYKCLRKNIDIRLFPIGSPTLEQEESTLDIVNDINKQSIFDKNDPCLKIWHQFDIANRIGIGKYTVLTFFETDKLRPNEICMINNTDTIMVASHWAKDILIDNGINVPIEVSPLGIDPNIFNEKVTDTVKKDNNKYVFLNIGKWEIRKGHDILVDIFNDAFTEQDNVELWMVNYNPFLTHEQNVIWHNLYKKSKLGNKIQILPRLNKHKDVAQVIKNETGVDIDRHKIKLIKHVKNLGKHTARVSLVTGVSANVTVNVVE